MSFGYSLGDFIAGANLSYRLLRAFSETQGACIEFQEAMTEIASLQQTFLLIGQMQPNRTLSRATINAAAHIVLSSMDLIAKFLEKTKRYRERLHNPGSAGLMSNSWQKMGWVLFKKEELVALRNTLHLKLSHINVLLATAQFYGKIPDNILQYQTNKQDVIILLPHDDGPDKQVHTAETDAVVNGKSCVDASVAPALPEMFDEGKSKHEMSSTLVHIQDPTTSMTRPVIIDHPMEAESDAGVGVTTPSMQITVPEVVSQEPVSRRLDPLEGGPANSTYQSQISATLETVEQAKRREIERGERMNRKPIRFKDAVGRKFSFPFHLCEKWAGMDELIQQAFVHVDVIGPHVRNRLYDLIGPHGEIILKQVWESVIQPDWQITMHMWPLPEPKGPLPEIRMLSPAPPPGWTTLGKKKSGPSAKGGGGILAWMGGKPGRHRVAGRRTSPTAKA